MYISASEFDKIVSALTFAADRVLESNGEISAFSDDPDENMLDAKTTLELVARMEEADVHAKDWALIAASSDSDNYAMDSCMDIINELYYDDYGRLRRAGYAVPTIEAWIAETKRTHAVSLDVFPTEDIERAHDILGDLWLDNEKAGDNNPDGTFKVNK